MLCFFLLFIFLLLFNHVGPLFLLLFFTCGAIEERAGHEAVGPSL
jgi:hypothetical protein